MTKILKSVTALLGLWLIVAISVFPATAALWIAFATAVAITAVASADVALEAVRRRRVSSAVATASLASFLIIASLVFESVSLGWLMAIAGGVIEAVALAALAFPRLGIGITASETRETHADAAAPRLAA